MKSELSMKANSSYLFGFIVLTCFVAPYVAAPRMVSAQVTLPDLAPQIVEITGDLVISFPSLRRQPLAGFNPPPRVPDITPGRIPFVEAYKQQSRDLPPSPLTAPIPPSMSSVALRKASTGMIEAGVGRYLTAYLKGTVSVPLNARTTLTARADLGATDGREPFSEFRHISTAADAQSGGVAIHSASGNIQYGADFGGDRNSYNLFGAISADTSLILSAPDRTISQWLGSAFVTSGSRGGSHLALEAGFGGSSVDTDLVNANSGLPDLPSTDESRFFMDASAAIDAQSGRLVGDLAYSRQSIDFSDLGTDVISSGNGSAGFHFDYSNQISVSASARILGFRADGQSESGGDRDLIYFVPDFRVRYTMAPGIEFSLVNAPEIETRSFADVYRLAPFAQDALAYQPVLTSTHLFGETIISNQKASIRGRVGWKDIQNYRVIENEVAGSTPYRLGYGTVSYEGASILYLEAEGMIALVSGTSASFSMVYRSGTLDDTDTDIPYLSPLSLSGFITLDPFGGELLLKGSLRLESPRYRDRAKTEKIDRVFGIGLEAAYFVTENAASVVGVRNLGRKTEFWDNYELDAGVFYAGVRWRW